MREADFRIETYSRLAFAVILSSILPNPRNSISSIAIGDADLFVAALDANLKNGDNKLAVELVCSGF
jgi:hypothetical protein